VAAPTSCYRMEDNLETSAVVQPSYWRFLAEKLPFDKEIGPIQEEEEEERSDEFNHDVQSRIDAVLHILIADNHKSHEAAQCTRHSAPSSGYCLKTGVSAPALCSKSKNRWGQSTSTKSSVRHSPKVPSRGASSSSGYASLPKRKEPPTHHRSKSLESGVLNSSSPGTEALGCRWSIPSTSSDDSLFVPRRVRES
jgi:hypothetical protein